MANLYRLENIIGKGLDAGDLIIEMGTTVFSTTGTQVTVTTSLGFLEAAFANAYGATVDPQDAPIQPPARGELTASTAVFTRTASGGSGTGFFYVIIGRKGTVAGP